MNLPLRFIVAADFELPVQPDRTRTRLLLSNARCCWTFDARLFEFDNGQRRMTAQGQNQYCWGALTPGFVSIHLDM
jgi:hypothetical protein